MTRKVWVANYSGHDYTAAEKFGEIQYVTQGYVSFGSLDRLKFLVADALKDAAEDDYILLSGAASLCVLSSLIMFNNYGVVNLLIFDKKADDNKGDYKPLVVKAETMLKIAEILGEKSIAPCDEEDKHSEGT